jgi:hypothetical protein
VKQTANSKHKISATTDLAKHHRRHLIYNKTVHFALVPENLNNMVHFMLWQKIEFIVMITTEV